MCVLKQLLEDGELTMAEGGACIERWLVPDLRPLRRGVGAVTSLRIIVLANRNIIMPFLGNDFYRECALAHGARGGKPSGPRE